MDEEAQDRVDDLCGSFPFSSSLPHGLTPCELLCECQCRVGQTDPEDLWDFGTVRNAAARPGTIGRANPNPMPVSGPPLTWEYNGDSVRSTDSGGSGSSQININGGRRGSSSGSDSNTSISSSITAKGDHLPPIPQGQVPGRFDHQATVRHGLPGEKGTKSSSSGGGGQRKEAVDEYDDYADDRVPEDDLADTTMLDSVVLPAIASVCLLIPQKRRPGWLLTCDFLCVQLFPRVSTQEARVALSSLQRAFTEAERIIPGVTMELVNEIVDSVEHVEDER